MKKNNFLTTIALSGCFCALYADIITVNQVGVGARAQAFANNYVAAANDMSAVYWNPAALSFLPVREFQAASDMVANTSTTTFQGTEEQSVLRRMRLADIGFMAALPTSKGGLTFAGALQNPIVFDNNPSFHGKYIDNSNRLIQDDQTYRGYGGLNFWSGAFGLQVAPGLGIGAAVSLVTGSESIKNTFQKLTSGVVVDSFNDSYVDETTRDYYGYDLRLGLMYMLPNQKVRLGMRITLPQTIWYDENYTLGNSKGQLYSSFSGAIGAAATLPFMTVSTELRCRAPYDYLAPGDAIPASSPASSTKMGAGAGFEIPLFNSNILVRLGYSWDQYDIYQFAMKYDNEMTGANSSTDNSGWRSTDTYGITYGVVKDRQQFSGGLAYVGSGMSIEASYGYQFWQLNANDINNNMRTDKDQLQRFLVSMSFRY